MTEPYLIGVCQLCGRSVYPSQDEDDNECPALWMSGRHPPGDVYWRRMQVIEDRVPAPPGWECHELCGKAICRDFGACYTGMTEEEYRKWMYRGASSAENEPPVGVDLSHAPVSDAWIEHLRQQRAIEDSSVPPRVAAEWDNPDDAAYDGDEPVKTCPHGSAGACSVCGDMG